MAYDNTTTIVGNITRDPELRFTPGGTAVANFSVAWNQKGRDGAEDKVSYFDITCWQQLAENVSDSLKKGDRVVVHGRLDQRSWEQDDGTKRSKVEIVADDVAPSLRWATAEVSKNQRNNNGGGQQGGQPQGNQNQGQQGGYNDNGGGQQPAAAPAGGYNVHEEPF